ncbi:MAG: amidase, partial [Betaproteobacteria bacterium]|nr:amidase [Betaproteobacteria bacterium]
GHAIRRGKLKARDALEAQIERIHSHDGAINAVVVRDFDHARQQADRIDRIIQRGSERQKQSLGPLCGVPITVKESYDLSGHPSTFGRVDMRNNIAGDDALMVKRLKAAGAVVMGKTNVPVRLSDWQSFNPIYGTTNNPFDLQRVPGGSSGGGAAALAAGLSFLELGSDIGGSIRGPAHFCGVFGHKPSIGMLSGAGHALPEAKASADLVAYGPLARYAADLDVSFELLLDQDASRHSLKPLPARLAKASGWRVALLSDAKTCPVDRDIVQGLEALGDRLEQIGVQLIRQGPPLDLDDVHRLYIRMLRAATSRSLSDREFDEQSKIAQAYRKGLRREREGYDYYAWMVQANTMSHREWLQAHEARIAMAHRWASWFDSVDVLLCPVASMPAFKHMQSGERWERMIPVNGEPQPSTQTMFWAGMATLCGLPGTAVPAGQTAQGLPYGVQVIGPRDGDRITLAFSALLEKRAGCQFAAPSAFA